MPITLQFLKHLKKLVRHAKKHWNKSDKAENLVLLMYIEYHLIFPVKVVQNKIWVPSKEQQINLRWQWLEKPTVQNQKRNFDKEIFFLTIRF